VPKYLPDLRKRVFFTTTVKPDPKKLPGLHTVVRADFPDGRTVWKYSLDQQSSN
jgi:hypothetical protein